MNKAYIAGSVFIFATLITGCATSITPYNPGYTTSYSCSSNCNNCNPCRGISNNYSNNVGYWGSPPARQWRGNSCGCNAAPAYISTGCSCTPCRNSCDTSWNDVSYSGGYPPEWQSNSCGCR